MKPFRLVIFAALAMLIASTAAMASDAEIAAKLKGHWQGYWKLGDRTGRVSANFTAYEENKFTGDATWYGMASKEMKLPFENSEVRDGIIHIYHNQGLSVESRLSTDGKSMKGTWGSAAGGGQVELKKGK